MKSKFIPILLTCACASLARADFNPVPLTANSYTFDIVVESNTVQAVPYCINVTAGNGTGLGDNSYYEQGMYSRLGQVGGNSGIPIHNTVLTNINDATMTFVMPSTYATNNTLMIDSTFGSGNFNFNAPASATNLAILGTGGGGPTTVGYTVTHADATTESGTLAFPDWFNGGTTVAWGANGRMDTSGNYNNFNNSSVNNNAPFLYANTITVSSGSPIVSIAFNFISGNHANLLAVSGQTAGTWVPIPLSGFNVMAIIPAAFPLTATMDQGTNTAYNGTLNTWFEQGYYPSNASYGLPPSGSILNSQSQPTHHYQMGNYSSNNAILIDTNHQIANITPVSPAAYTSFAFLTAGGNIGGGQMVNTCILQHLDGVIETNTFYGYDWYNGSIAPAYVSNGRINMANRTFNTIGGGNPKLFESYFVLNDLTSPVTNIMVLYGTAPSSDSTTYIMAISASTNAVPPVIVSGPLPVNQSWYPSETATFTVQVAGSSPLTNSWLVESNGLYVPLKDGVDANGSTISGSGTTTLTLRNLTLADATNYEYVAANAVSSVTSSPASLSISGRAGVVAISGWNNIANETYPVGTATNIYSSDGSTSATLTLYDMGVTNAWNSGITGDGADYSLMHGYIDAGSYGGIDAIVNISGLTGSTYDVYIYCLADQTRPAGATNGLPNYNVNGTTYYAPVLGATGASTCDATSTSVGGTGFNGFVPATTSITNDFNQDLSVSSFGNYIKIANVSAAGGQITVQAEADTTTFRSPLNGIEIVNPSNGQAFGINFLGNTTDAVAPGKPTAPIIDSQIPTGSFGVLTNHVDTTVFSVTIDASSAPPLYYQWYNGSTAIPNATNASYANVDTNVAAIYCIITNFAGSATSSPVAITIYAKPTPSAYQSAVLAFNPVAYWPLNETSGNIAFDYASTNDGVYTGTYTLGQPGLPATVGIGANTSVGFDGSTAYVDIPVGGLNITGPLTLIEWVQPPSGGEPNFATSLGHSDQSYRLDVVGGQPHFADDGPDITDPNSIGDGNWHQLVGVYDGTNQYLYVDGVAVGGSAQSTPAGSTDDVWIGGAPDYAGARNFKGNIAQVAILTKALTAAEVAAIYGSLDTAPTVAITPANPSVYAGSDVTLTANLTGTSATSLQWYYIDTLNNSNNIAGATNATYTIANTSLSLNGYTYGIVAGNAYGTNIAAVVLSVQNGPAYLVGDISPLTGEAYVGAPVTYSVNAQGSLPIYYQWTVDGVVVPGATNATFTAAAACGLHTIQASFTNASSGGFPITSSQATLQGDAYPTNITFNTNGTGWQLNGSVVTLANNVLGLTDGGDGESSSAFYLIPQYVGSFTASFTYVGNGSADGSAFILQNGAVGATALGGGGGGLGYYGISNSVALEFNLYQVVGIAPGTNGNTYGAGGGAIYQPTGPIDIASGHPINFKLNFADGVLSVDMVDATTLATYSTSYTFGPLIPLLGGTDLAYVGFSGADGGISSIQTISNFEFNSVIPPVALSVSPVTTNSFKITWPAADPSYELQTTSSLSAPTWATGPVPVVVNGINQVTINVNGGTPRQFYRLVRVVCQ